MIKSDDSWLVIGSGRTGSKFIVDVIRQTYEHSDMTLKYISPDTIIPGNVQPGMIVHTHDISYLNRISKNTKVVLSTRNHIDSSLSFCIQPYTGVWHQYSDLSKRYDKSIQVVPFHLELHKLYQFVQIANKFNIQIRPKLPEQSIVIDYSDFTQSVIHTSSQVVCEFLSLPLLNNINELPIKNIGNPEDWISNWPEVEQVCHKLHKILKY